MERREGGGEQEDRSKKTIPSNKESPSGAEVKVVSSGGDAMDGEIWKMTEFLFDFERMTTEIWC